jgi:hypothetical protein
VTPRRSYTPEQVDTALLTLILAGRNSGVASRRLAENGIEVNPRTLRSWRDKVHADRYAELEHQHAPQIEKQMMSQARAIATAANIATLEAIEAARKQVEAGEARDPSTVARNLAVTMGVATDKSLLLDGRPTEIHSSQDVEQLLADVRRMLGPSYARNRAIDTTATELEAASPEG